MSTEPNSPRYPKANMSVFSLSFLQIHNPFVVMWWSAAIPGFGHLMLGKYAQGFILIIWELYTNYHSELNLSIFYSMLGDFDRAKDVLDTEWLMLYVAVYVFTLWDSFRRAIMLNQVNILAEHCNARIPVIRMNTLGIHVLNRYRPWVAIVCSLLLPGLGQVYLQRLMTGLYILVIWVAACTQSRLLTAIHHTCVGNFELAAGVMVPHWLLFLPSLYGYAMFEAYHSTQAINSLNAKEQASYLEEHYLKKREEGRFMEKLQGPDISYTAASFKHSLEVEVILSQMDMVGIKREALLVVPLYSEDSRKRLIQGYFYLEERLMNLAFPLGTVFMLLGVIYGFVLPMGPVLWGLFGLLAGLALGVLLGYLTRDKRFPFKQTEPEVILIVQGTKEILESAKEIIDRFSPVRVYPGR